VNDSNDATVFHPRAKAILDRALSLHRALNTDDILTGLVEDITGFFGAERVRLFAFDAADNEVYTRIKLSDAFVELKFPVSDRSVAGYTALHKRPVTLDDVTDPAELARYPGLQYDASFEEHTGVRVKSIISAPLLENGSDLTGIIQLVNTARPVRDYAAGLDFLDHLGKVVAAALFHQDERQRRATKFDLLVEEGIVSQDELSRAVRMAAENRDDPIDGDPVSVLMRSFRVPEESMKASLSRYYLTDFMSFDESLIIPPELFQGYNPGYFQRNLAIPVKMTAGTLSVLMDNPFNSNLVRELKRTYRAAHCRLFVGFRRDIFKYIDQVQGNLVSDGMADAQLEMATADPGDTNENRDEDILSEDAPLVVQIVNKLILDAFERGVSDIHVEPGLTGDDTLIRFRRDGVCFQHTRIPANLSPAVISRIKVLAQMKLEEHRFPQSGKIRLKYRDSVIELRVETTPTVGRKEDVVLRILAGGTFLSIDELDLAETNRSALLGMIAKPYGILLAVGPTGSGKTTTLHAILHRMNSVEKKIWTVEDPVEITQAGLRQVQVNLNIKPEPFDFAKAMRSFLRADPDIIMVGEMRDKETATIAVEASLTGHLVLSTLHTNSAPETITRLIEMGIDPLNVADSLLGVLAQRLVRVLCAECRARYVPDDGEIDALAVACGRAHAAACHLDEPVTHLFRPVGCEACSGTGFRGRMGIHELLAATPAVKQAISTGQAMTVIRDQALADGMSTLKMDGIRRIIAGQTTLAEVLKVCID
jgi:type II secretory ATPase GspE/PulE/Tfp pilus assembly ATPase PilB-like protein